MQIIRLIDVVVSFICACVAWQIMFGSSIPVESAISALILFPVLGFIGVMFELFKVASFFVIFLSTMFVFEQLILIIRSIGHEYNHKMNPGYHKVLDLSDFPEDPTSKPLSTTQKDDN